MSPNLIFLFIFQSSLAFAFAFFITTIIAKESTSNTIPKVRNLLIFITLFISGFAFWVYEKSLPAGEPIEKAFWPTLWIFMVMMGLVLGITFAYKKVRSNSDA